MPTTSGQETQVKGEFSTAEVTHVLEAIRLEGQCYVKNHLLMKLSGEEGAIREWHDNVTRANLERLKPIAGEMGIPLPFPKRLEERENELKEKVKGMNVGNILTKGEALAEVKTAGKYLAQFYTQSLVLATHERVRDAFRGGFENVADNLPRVLQALKETDQFYPPPNAITVGLVAEKGVPVEGKTTGSSSGAGQDVGTKAVAGTTGKGATGAGTAGTGGTTKR